MAKTIVQFRYFGDPVPEDSAEILSKDSIIYNQPTYISKARMWVEGDLNPFLNKTIKNTYGLITQIGIQGTPGTKIYINQSKDPVIIGGTGIFELDLTGYSHIYSLKVDYKSASIIEERENGYLIIDAVYDSEVV